MAQSASSITRRLPVKRLLDPGRTPRHSARLGLLSAALVGAFAPTANAATFTVNSDASLRTALTRAVNGDVINFSGDVTLSANLPVLTANATINGNGYSLSGAGQYRGLFVASGTWAINNLTIQQTKAIGGNGGNGGEANGEGGGGGGSAGMGGGLFVKAGAAVTLTAVNFSANAAQGGKGGNYSSSNGNIFEKGDGGGGGGGGLGGNGLSAVGAAPGAGGAALGGIGGGGKGGNGAYLAGTPPPTDYAGAAGGFGAGGGGGAGGLVATASGGTRFARGAGGAGGFGGGSGGGSWGGGGSVSAAIVTGGVALALASADSAMSVDAVGASAPDGFAGGTGGSILGGGGGGSGLGGAVFVMEGGTLTLSGSAGISGSSVAGGAGGIGGIGVGGKGPFSGTAGRAFGAGLFLQGNGSLSLAPGAGQTQTFADVMADQTGSGGTGADAGAWAIVKSGAGTTVLSANNTYRGGTTVSAGTLQIGNGGTTGSIAGNVVNNAVLAFNRSDDISFAGVISGSGGLNKLGAGTLTLTGTNPYSGGTQINAGRVQIASTANLGTGGVSFDGGTLAVGASSFSLGKAVLLNAGGGSFEVGAGATLTLDQPVTGSGGLTRLGAGTLQVASGNFGGGLVNGSGGTLVVTNVQAGGAVMNQGTVALTRNSRLISSALRNDGTINVSGSDLFNPAVLKATAAGQAIVNNGQLLVSGSSLSVSGAFSNTAGGRVVLSGASFAAFLNSVDFMGGQLDVSANANVAFQGDVNQLTGASFTGTGTKIYNKSFSLGAALPGLASDEGAVTFGSSNVFTTLIGGTAACTSACADNPGLQALSYSHYSVGGNLQLGGTLKLGSVGSFVAQAGQRFDLLDWGSLQGRFGGIDASGLLLASGTVLDTSKLYIDGSISVVAAPVPEPASWGLLLVGLSAVALRRQRGQRI